MIRTITIGSNGTGSGDGLYSRINLPVLLDDDPLHATPCARPETAPRDGTMMGQPSSRAERAIAEIRAVRNTVVGVVA